MYEPDFVATRVSPQRGRVQGGTLLELSSTSPWMDGFPLRADCFCRFSEPGDGVDLPMKEIAIVPAQCHFAERIVTCTTPEMAKPIVTVVQVSVNGFEWTVKPFVYFEFYFEEEIKFTSMWPPLGSVQGGNTVDVRANGLFPFLMENYQEAKISLFDPEAEVQIPQTYCRWNKDFVQYARVKSKGELVCNVPSRFHNCANDIEPKLPVDPKTGKYSDSYYFGLNPHDIVSHFKQAANKLPADPCFDARDAELEISFAGNPPKWLSVDAQGIQFLQHPIVSYAQSYQLITEPLYGFGNVIVTIDGSGFIPTTGKGYNDWKQVEEDEDKVLTKCVWNLGYTMTAATILSDTKLRCRAPLLSEIMTPEEYEIKKEELPFNSNIDITLDSGETTTHFSVIYKYIELFIVSQLEPSYGPWRGGTEVSIIGAKFIKSPAMLCKFSCPAGAPCGNEEKAVPAVFVSAILLKCQSPELKNPGNLGFQDYDFSYSVDAGQVYKKVPNVRYRVMSEPELNSITAGNVPQMPNPHEELFRGPYSGHVKVNLFGKYIANTKELACKFGQFTTPAIWIGDNGMADKMATCYAPSCKDAKGMVISQLDDGVYKPCAGKVKVSLTLNGQEYFGDLAFEYLDRQQITSVAPFATAYNYKNLDVVISGINFADPGSNSKQEMWCRFCVNDLFDLPSVKAIEVTEKSMKCRAPELPEKFWPKYFDTVLGFLEISPNDQDYTRDRTPWVWYEGAKVEEILPRTTVHSNAPQGYFIVKGKNFRRLQAEQQLKCQWFYDQNETPELVEAHYLSPTELKCRPTKAAAPVKIPSNLNKAKDQKYTKVRLEVAMTLQTYSKDEQFVYAEEPLSMRHYYKDEKGEVKYNGLDFSGYDTDNTDGIVKCTHLGGCELGLRGVNLWNEELEDEAKRDKNIIDGLYIIVGDTIVEARHWMSSPHLDGAYYLDPVTDQFEHTETDHSNYASFKVPPVAHKHPVQTAKFVKITRNLQDISQQTSGAFVSYRKLEAGYYYRPEVNNGTFTKCPRGHYCEGALSTQNYTEWHAPPGYPIECPPGTFQNFTGRGDCKPCPEGTVCKNSAQAEPTLCENGLICWGNAETLLKGIGYDANMPMCPAGVLCLRPPYGKTPKEERLVRRRVLRLLVATESDAKFVDKLMDIVLDHPFDNPTLNSHKVPYAEKTMLRRRMQMGALRDKITTFNETLANAINYRLQEYEDTEDAKIGMGPKFKSQKAAEKQLLIRTLLNSDKKEAEKVANNDLFNQRKEKAKKILSLLFNKNSESIRERAFKDHEIAQAEAEGQTLKARLLREKQKHEEEIEKDRRELSGPQNIMPSIFDDPSKNLEDADVIAKEEQADAEADDNYIL